MHRVSSASLDKTNRCIVDFDRGHDVDDDDNDENTKIDCDVIGTIAKTAVSDL